MGVTKVYLTEAGARAAMYCQHHAQAVEFTRFGIGDGQNMSPQTATAMAREVVRFAVGRIQHIDGGHYKVVGEMPNTSLTNDLEYRELGLYCKDPEAETDEEILYCYGNAKGVDFDYTETIPAFDNTGAYTARKFEVDLFLENDNGAKMAVHFDGVELSQLSELNNDLVKESEAREAGDAEAKDLANATGILSAAHGGTGNTQGLALGLEAAGYDGFDEASDQPRVWASKGTVIWEINDEDQINGQPSVVGTILSIEHDSAVNQLWFDRDTGDMYHRTGKSDGAFTTWLKIADSNSASQGGGGSATNAPSFSYVVDSSAALLAWANNDRSKGQDYTSVLIRKGTWTSSKGVNLTTAGTKVVKGEPGSKLEFNTNSIYGLSYNTAPITAIYYMEGVNVSCRSNNNGEISAFLKCGNMSNCTATAETNGDFSNGFNQCRNLTNCTGEATGSAGAYAFSECTGVFKCGPGGESTTGVFNSCYASNEENEDYACADTPAGGFNDTTNHSA